MTGPSGPRSGSAARPTCPAFGGEELRQLFVTSATTGLDDAARAAQPEAGWLQVIDISAPGLPDGDVRL